MIAVQPSPGAKADLLALGEKSVTALADAMVLVTEMLSADDINDRLFTYGDARHFNIKPVAHHKNSTPPRFVWRIKVTDRKAAAFPYRVVYALRKAGNGLPAKIFILAVAEKASFNYEPNHPTTLRINA